MKKTSVRRVLAMAMVLVMTLSAVPFGAFAEGVQKPACTCKTLCDTTAPDKDCPVCAAEGADVGAVCCGKLPEAKADAKTAEKTETKAEAKTEGKTEDAKAEDKTDAKTEEVKAEDKTEAKADVPAEEKTEAKDAEAEAQPEAEAEDTETEQQPEAENAAQAKTQEGEGVAVLSDEDEVCICTTLCEFNEGYGFNGNRDCPVCSTHIPDVADYCKGAEPVKLMNLVLDANGGTVDGVPTKTIQVAFGYYDFADYTGTGKPPVPVRDGYVLDYWKTDEGDRYGGGIDCNRDRTLTAQWVDEAMTRSITVTVLDSDGQPVKGAEVRYDRQDPGGNVWGSATTDDNGQAVFNKLIATSDDNGKYYVYTYTVSYKYSEKEVQLTGGNQEVVFGGQQTSETCKITYVDEAYGNTSIEETVTKGSTIRLPGTPDSWTVYGRMYLAGWQKDGEFLEDGQELTVTEDITLKANWQEGYVVSFHDDSITNGYEILIHAGQTSELKTPDAFQKEGYVLKGWAKEKDGPVVYKLGATVTAPQDFTDHQLDLYAVWQSGEITLEKGDLPAGFQWGSIELDLYNAFEDVAEEGERVLKLSVEKLESDQSIADYMSGKYKGAVPDTYFYLKAERFVDGVSKGTVPGLGRIELLYPMDISNICDFKSGGRYKDSDTANSLESLGSRYSMGMYEGTVYFYLPTDCVVGFKLTDWVNFTVKDPTGTNPDYVCRAEPGRNDFMPIPMNWKQPEGAANAYPTAFKDGDTVYEGCIFTEKDMVLEAVWSWTISVDLDGGTYKFGDDLSYTTDAYGKIYGSLPDAHRVTKDGYTLKGWKLKDGTPVDDDTVYTGPATLVAEWEEVTGNYTITLKYNDGMTPDGTMKTDAQGKLTESLPIPARNGYTFVGWFMGDVEMTDDAIFSGNATLEARWEKQGNKYVINYVFSDAIFELEYNVDETVTLPTLEELDWSMPANAVKFLGWADGSTVYQPGTEVPAYNQEVYLEATWECKVTLDWGTGSKEITVQVPTENLQLETPVRTGYRFLGWYFEDIYSDKTDKTTKVEDGVYIDDGNLPGVFTAKWEEIDNTYTITLKYNDGTTPDSTLKTDKQGKLTGLPTPTRPGYDFVAWELNGNAVRDGALFSGDATLVAHWEVAQYTITLVNGEAETTMVTDGSWKLPDLKDPEPREGYTFAGWYTQEDHQPVTKDTVFTKDTTIVAYWNVAVYRVTLYFNDNKTEPVVIVTGDGWQLSETLPTPTRLGYTFQGWYLKDTDTKVEQDHVFKANTDLVAKWEPVKVDDTNIADTVKKEDLPQAVGTPEDAPEDKQITEYRFPVENTIAPAAKEEMTALAPQNAEINTFELKVQVGYGTGDTTEVWVDVKQTDAPIPFRINMELTGKFVKVFHKHGDGAAYELPTSAYSWDDTGVTIYLDKFSPVVVATLPQYTVTFKDGSNTASQNVGEGMDCTVPAAAAAWTQEGKHLIGWSATENATAADPDVLKNITANKTVYAVWEDDTYTVEFYTTMSASGAQTKVDTQTFTYNQAQQLKTVSLASFMTGYDFQGWSETSGSKTAEIAADATLQRKEANGAVVKLYAVWQYHAYTVTLHQNHDSADTTIVDTLKTQEGNGTTTMNTLAKLTDPAAWQDHYFVGWFDAAGKEVKVNETKFTADTELYAHWEDFKSITVSFDPQGGSFKVGGTTYNKAGAYTLTTVWPGTLRKESGKENGVLSQLPPDAGKTGYRFEGWYYGGKKVEANVTGFTDTNGDGKETVTAVWKYVISSTGNPRTGDQIMLGLALTVLVLASAGLVTVVVLKKRRS